MKKKRELGELASNKMKETKSKWIIFFIPSLLLYSCAIYLTFFKTINVVIISTILSIVATWLLILSKVLLNPKKAKQEASRENKVVELK